MKRLLLPVTICIILFTGSLKASESYSFSISADVEKSASINLTKDIVIEYIRNLDIYPKFFPDIISVTKLNEKDSEWLYKIKAPLASSYSLAFILEDRSSSHDTLVLESKDSTKDYLNCKAVFSQVTENSTKVTLRFHIIMTRDKASEVHFMAGILGEKFLSERMKEKLDSDMDTFFNSVTKDMYLANRELRGD